MSEERPLAASDPLLGTTRDAGLVGNVDDDEVNWLAELGLRSEAYRGLEAFPRDALTPVNQRIIAPMLEGKDVIAQVPEDGGWALASLISILQRLDARSVDRQALVLTPTREVAKKMHEIIELIGSPMGVRSMWLTAGGAVRDNLCTLSREVVHVVCGTPGRCLDMTQRGNLKLDKVRTVVIHGADEILSRGYAEQLQELWSSGMPSEVQVAVFSETMPPELEALARFTRDPVRILVLEKRTLDRVEQFYVPVGAGDERARMEALFATLDRLKTTQAVVYCSSRRSVEWVAGQLTERGVAVASSHTEASVAEQEAARAALRTGAARLLVTTDGCARGEDVHVIVCINYQLPVDVPSYVARVWRAGRLGHKAVALNLVADGDTPLDDKRFQADVEKRYGTPWRPFDEMPAAVAETL